MGTTRTASDLRNVDARTVGLEASADVIWAPISNWTRRWRTCVAKPHRQRTGWRNCRRWKAG